MVRQLIITLVKLRVIQIRLNYPGLQIIRDDSQGSSAEKLEGLMMFIALAGDFKRQSISRERIGDILYYSCQEKNDQHKTVLI